MLQDTGYDRENYSFFAVFCRERLLPERSFSPENPVQLPACQSLAINGISVTGRLPRIMHRTGQRVPRRSALRRPPPKRFLRHIPLLLRMDTGGVPRCVHTIRGRAGCAPAKTSGFRRRSVVHRSTHTLSSAFQTPANHFSGVARCGLAIRLSDRAKPDRADTKFRSGFPKQRRG